MTIIPNVPATRNVQMSSSGVIEILGSRNKENSLYFHVRNNNRNDSADKPGRKALYQCHLSVLTVTESNGFIHGNGAPLLYIVD